MAVSSSRNYSVTGTNIINGAFEYIQVKDVEESMSANMVAMALSTLEQMIKTFQAEGLGLWTLDEAALFQSDEGYSYDIYTSGTNCATTWVKTELSAASAATDTTLDVDSDDDMTDGDYIGIELDDGTLEWTTINGTPASDVVTITTGLTSAAGVDNHVYTYTTKCTRPIEITEARIHSADGTDIPLSIISREEYMAFSDKTTTGKANSMYCDSRIDRMTVNIWPACDDVKDYIRCTVKLPIMDMDSATNDPEFPQEWYEALVTNLAVRLAPKCGRVASQELISLAVLSKTSAENFDREQVSTFFKVSL